MSKHQYEYRKAMDSIHVSREWEDDMIQKILNAEKAQKKRIHRAHRLGLAAVAAAACLTIGAGAAEAATGIVSDIFAPLLGTAHTEIIDNIGYPVNASDSAGGVTVTADAVIGDNSSVCVIFSMTKDDGTPWTEVPDSSYLVFEDSTFDFNISDAGDGVLGAHGGSWFISDDPENRVIRFVEQRTVEDGMPSGHAKETLKNLCIWDEASQSTKTLVKGKWTLRFDLDFEDTSKQFPSGQAVEFLGEPAVITELMFSPISFSVTVEQNRTEYPLMDDKKYLDGTSEAMDQLDIVLNLKDGREIDLGYWAGGSYGADEGKSVFTKSSMFNEVIPLEDMESVTVCGTEIPLR
ncbi:MAG: DUF4179 domain-containing protein [Clostridiaceae bacterium]|nr:DUF4179 domain-containing protein [Clostridiaceae bacterium]